MASLAAKGKSSATVVEVFDVAFSFPGDPAHTTVLHRLSFTVRQGEFVVLVGPSGAGKSTILRVIAGLVHPQNGDVYVQSIHNPQSRAIGFVFQDPRLLPWRRIRQNVEFGLEGLIESKADRTQRALEALSLVGLAKHADRWPHELSGGERQRVGIARALAVRPALLLMDEPFGALDPSTREVLQDELLGIWNKTQASVVFVTHDMNEAIYLADRIIVLGGKPAQITREFTIDASRPRQRGAHYDNDAIAEIKSKLYETFNHKTVQ